MRAYPNCTARNSPKENLTEHSIANCSAHAFPLLLFYCQPLIMAKSHHGVHTNPLAGLELTSSHPHSRKKHQCPLVPAAQMLTSTSSSLCALPSFYSFWLNKKIKKKSHSQPSGFQIWEVQNFEMGKCGKGGLQICVVTFQVWRMKGFESSFCSRMDTLQVVQSFHA